MAVSRGGRYFAWAGVEKETDPARRIHLMDAAGQKEIRTMSQREPQRLLAFLPDGNIVIAGNYHGFHALDTATGRELWSLRHHRTSEPMVKTPPPALSIAEKTGLIATAIGPSSISLVDAASGRHAPYRRGELHRPGVETG